MNDSNSTLREPVAALSPRIEAAGPLLIAGLRIPLDAQAAQKIPQLWNEFVASQHTLAQRVGEVNYGLCVHAHGYEYQYLAACAVWDFNGLPDRFSAIVIPAQQYAVFAHRGSVANIKATIDFAFDQWLPDAPYRHATGAENTVHFFERYGEQFDPLTGTGDIEIWLPLLSQ